MQKLKDFKEVLETNPRFQYGTINVYVAAIRELTEKHGESPSVDDLNSFIAYKCQRRQPQVKYAIREYLIMLGRKPDYDLLVQAKIRKPTRPKIFLPLGKLQEISEKITKEPYRTIAKLQMSTAARSIGIITVEQRKVRKEEELDRIRLTLMEKGDKPNEVFLRLDKWKLIEPYMTEKKKYLFLPKDAATYSREKLARAIKNLYKRYLEKLQEAARDCGIEIATHDIRRSVANIVNQSTLDPRITQRLLNHSSLDVTNKYLEDNSKQMSEVLLKHQADL